MTPPNSAQNRYPVGTWAVIFIAVATMYACVAKKGSHHLRSNISSEATAPAPDIAEAGFDGVMKWSESQLRLAEDDFNNSGNKRLESPSFWGDQVFYEIMPDRFADGDPSNNFKSISSEQREGMAGDFAGIAEYHHGGDLRGIKDRLGYLSDLGITALWITPVFLNASGSYHGYCVSDPTKLDPNFGTAAELRELVAAAHKRGIRIVLDIVVNHMCDMGTTYTKSHTPNSHQDCAADLDRANSDGQEAKSPHQVELAFSPNFFPPFRKQSFFNRCGANSISDMQGETPVAVFGDFTGVMLDFNTRDSEFQAIFTKLMAYWIAYADVDGFRLDAVKHTTSDFSAYFATMTRDYAAKLGKDHFYTVAEVAGNSKTIALHLGRMNPDNNTGSWRMTMNRAVNGDQTLAQLAAGNKAFPYPGVSAVYDFAHSGIARDALANVRASRVLEDYFKVDGYHQDLVKQGDPRLNMTVMEIHDWPRFAEKSADKSALALAYLAVAPGVPVIYYGMEQGFNGRCNRDSIDPQVSGEYIENFCFGAGSEQNDGHFRQDMFSTGMLRLGSVVPSINSLAHIGTSLEVATTTDPYLDQTNFIYKTARRFLGVRKSCSLLSKGDITWRWSTTEPAGLMAFTRADPFNRANEALVVINTSDEELTIPDLNVENSSKDFVDLVGPRDQRPIAATGNLLRFRGEKIRPNTVRVFISKAMVGPWSESEQAFSCIH